MSSTDCDVGAQNFIAKALELSGSCTMHQLVRGLRAEGMVIDKASAKRAMFAFAKTDKSVKTTFRYREV